MTKSQKQLNTRELKRKIVSDELAEVRKKKAVYAIVIKENTKEADKISGEGEEKQDFILLSQSNILPCLIVGGGGILQNLDF